MSIKRVLVLPDIHIPYEDGRSIGAVLSYAKTRKWDECIILGDFLDLEIISRYTEGNIRVLENKSLEKDFELGNKWLDRIQSATNCKTVFLLGNHEARADKYIDKHPQLRGLIEPELRLNLKKRKIQLVRSWTEGEVYKIGKASFIHGYKTTDLHTKAAVLAYECNVFMGHVHDRQLYSKQSKGSNTTKVGESLGCLCKYNQPYMKYRPSRWQQAFAEFAFREDGYFNHWVTNIFNHAFVGLDGKLYQD